MKTLSIKQILITILLSYLTISFINAEMNPFNLDASVRAFQIFATAISLVVQLGIKNID